MGKSLNFKEKNKKSVYFEGILKYYLFSSLKIFFKSTSYEILSNFKPTYFIGTWYSNLKLSNNSCIFVFLQTTENLYNFVKFFVRFTDKLKIFHSNEKIISQIESNYFYLIMKNSLNSIRISSGLQNLLIPECPFLSIKESTKDCFFLTEITGKKLKLQAFNFFKYTHETLNIIPLNQKNKTLDLQITLNFTNFNFFLNSVNLEFSRKKNSFFEFLNLLIKNGDNKILLIINDVSILAGFFRQILINNFSILSKFSSVKKILKDLKQFNSGLKPVLITCSEVWENKSLFNRIDPRDLTVILKINLTKLKKVPYIKSFFYF
jgi:hypothetical protein